MTMDLLATTTMAAGRPPGETGPQPVTTVADVAQVEFSFGSTAAEKQRVAVLRQHGYRSVFDQRGYIVLHRASTVARAGLSRAAGR